MSGRKQGPLLQERFSYEQRDRKGRLVSRSGMGRSEFIFRKALRWIEDVI